MKHVAILALAAISAVQLSAAPKVPKGLVLDKMA